MLRGAPPFAGASDAEIRAKHLLERPPTLLQGLLQDIPDDLDKLVLELMAKLPADRPHSPTHGSW